MSETTLELPVDTNLPEGAPAPEAAAEDRPRTAREEVMLSIVARAEERRNAELAYGERAAQDARDTAALESPDPEEAAQREEDATEAARRALETQPQPQRTQTPTPPQQSSDIIEIDGLRFTREQASQLARDGLIARRTVTEFQRQQQAPQQPQYQPQAAPPPPQPRGPVISDEDARGLARGLVYGDEAENVRTIQRMAEIMASRTPAAPQIDPNAIINAAVQRTHEQTAFNRNLEVIGREYPEIFNSTKRAQVAGITLVELRQKYAALGVQRPDLDLYREACQTVREELGFSAPAPQSAPAASPAPQAAQPSRLDRKRAAPTIPQAADRRAGTAPAQRFPTNSEYIEQLRRQRGQAPMR